MKANHKGQSLIEVVVALAIVIMLAISLVATTLLVQKASKNARNSTQATKLVQQNIEQVRIFRDRNPGGFDALPSSGCYRINTAGADPASWSLVSLASCSSIPPAGAEALSLNNTTFSRWLAFAAPTNTQKTLIVTVSWADSSGPQQVSNSTFLSKPCTGQIGAGGGATPCP
ncbi:MAG: type II secretion system protein [Candidatus Curtissbacteria bacterium]|nr:type II secretion system protein [Candidatus Curtissbacteria bacterium]